MIEKDKIIEKYNSFFKEIKKFQEKQNKQKLRGLNDYNLLTTVLEPHDEVRLHSRMIGSLLDPNGLHYQDTLFLEKFLDMLILDDFEMDLENIYVGVEYHNIDLYITDGAKHIIIENKIWAYDQPCQIIKYINIIVEENKDSFFNPKENDIISKDLLRVVYLTPQNKDLPNEHIIKDGYLSFDNKKYTLDQCSKNMKNAGTINFDLKNYQVKFTKIDYKDISNWLKKCKSEVQNITNLSEAIRQYIDVVKIINKDYKGKVMGLEKYLKYEQKIFNTEDINIFLDEIDEMQQKIPKLFLDKLKEKVKNFNIRIENTFIDIFIDKYFIRYIIIDDSKLVLQIGDEADRGFNNLVNENTQSRMIEGLKKINKNFTGDWKKSYGQLKMGNIKFQTQNKLLEDINEYNLKIINVLENF